jgi:DNA-binding CsgD family transcriptional regulator/PAS domain-containing protein
MMQRLRAADARAVLDFVSAAYTVPPPGGFRLHVLERLRALVPSDMTAWVETRIGRPEVRAIASPHDMLPDGPRRFARIRDEHPVLAHFERSRHGGAAKLSDFLTPTQYRRSRLYQEFFLPAGVEHQISIALPSSGARLVRITLNRAGGDYAERDRTVLDLVRPHLACAQETVEAFERLGAERDDLERAAEAADVGVVRIRDGRPSYVNPRARALLAAYFGARTPERQLPDGLADRLRGTGDPPLPQGLVVEGDGGVLEVRSLSSTGGQVLVLRERLTRIPPRLLESLGLTRRQAEVLSWLAQGKANVEIAAILAISPNTVARHVEAIFEALGVQSRTAAAAAAFTHVTPA